MKYRRSNAKSLSFKGLEIGRAIQVLKDYHHHHHHHVPEGLGVFPVP